MFKNEGKQCRIPPPPPPFNCVPHSILSESTNVEIVLRRTEFLKLMKFFQNTKTVECALKFVRLKGLV